jgi:ATP-binding cassette subfamily C (CFTR/MRP) protein 4
MIVGGLVSFRAMDRLEFFRIGFQREVEKGTNVTFTYNGVNRWVAMRMDFCVMALANSIAIAAVCYKGKLSNDQIAYILQVITDVCVLFSFACRLLAELENLMTSSQRIVGYTELEPEDELEKKDDKELISSDWPKQGEVEFENATMRYREHLEPCIRELSFKVKSGMKVGIVGRTGAGKSSILQALFRLSELQSGRILIDGVEISKIGLHTLRKRIAFIPQMPFLLQGTIRENIDPFYEASDERVKEVIKIVKLEEKIACLKNGLQTEVKETNTIFSVGQKQLICLGRAMIRNTKILVLDEATANVDLETDNFIQTRIKDIFTNCTVLVIAHRLATVIDSDRILVMADGRAEEFDHPFKLLTNDDSDISITRAGFFAKMVNATGQDSARQLFDIARTQYRSQNRC